MERFWRQLGVTLGKRWKLVFVGLAVVTVVLGIGLSKVEFATGESSYLNSDSQVAVDNREFQAAFGGEAVVLLFTLEDGRDFIDLFTPDNIAAFEQLETQLHTLPEAASVLTPLTSIQWSSAIAQGPGTNALLSAAQRDPDPASKELRNADVQLSLARLGGVENRELGDPVWMEFLIYGNDGYQLVDGEVVSPPPEERVVRASLRSTFPKLGIAVGGVVLKGNATLDELSAGTDDVLAAMDGLQLDGATSITTGSPVYLKEINDYLQSGMLVLGALAIGVMAVILTFVFRVRWRLLPLLAVIFGIIWSFSIIGYLGIDLSLVTIAGLPILIGMGIDFAIQVHNRVEEEVVLDQQEHPIAETAANIGPPLIAATVAAVVALLTLRISKVPMIRDFGLLLAIGIVVLVVVGIVVPLTVLGIREWRQRTTTRKPSAVEAIVVKLGSLSSRWVVPMALISVVLVALGVSLESRTEIQSDPVRWIDQGSQTVADIGTLEDSTGFATTLGVLIESNNVLAPEVSEVITDFVFDSEALPAVAVTSSLVGTMAKIIDVPGTTRLAPTPVDLEAALAVAPPDIARALVANDQTSAQVNLRLAPASLEERSVIVDDLRADLDARLAAVELGADSVLDDGLPEGDEPIRAVPAGLAVVGVGLLENLTANREALTYLALAAATLWLVIRFRSLSRALLTMVPAILAVGVSSILVAALGITLSPLTTVSGPLVVATCLEFSVLITGRYIEERETGLSIADAHVTAARRTGRAFFTSAITTVGGFATLVISPLPLLRDFGIIVAINVAIAVLAALVIMPPLLAWADEHSLIGIERRDSSVRLAAPTRGKHLVSALVSGAALVAVIVVLLANIESDDGKAQAVNYQAIALPTTTTTTTTSTTTTTVAGEEPPPPTTTTTIDPNDYGTERPAGIVTGALFDLLTAQGVPANQAVCTAEVLLTRTTEDALLASGIAEFTDEALVPVVQSGLDCGISQEQIDATIAAARGG